MKVLVADDDPGSLLVAQAAVERSGHECLAAADGDAAWAMYQEHSPDVVVTDWMMPGTGPVHVRCAPDVPGLAG